MFFRLFRSPRLLRRRNPRGLRLGGRPAWVGLLISCTFAGWTNVGWGQAESAPRSLADELSKPKGKADADAERATAEILAPLEESPEMRPHERAAAAFAPPPGAKRLSKTSNLWVDTKQKRVYVDGYVTLREGYLEMFACPTGTKEHESIVAVLAQSREVHAALLAVGATPGSPVQYDPEFKPPTGQSIRVWVLWRDEQGRYQTADARRWVRNAKTGEAMDEDWVFGGSGFWKDPADGKEYYQADGGDLICVSNFSTATMDVPFASSADADSLLYVPFKERIPERPTPVRLVLVPIPDKSDSVANDSPTKQPAPPTKQPAAPTKQPAANPDQAPTEDALPVAAKPDEETAKPDEKSGPPNDLGGTPARPREQPSRN